MAQFTNPIGMQQTSVPTVTAPPPNTVVADVLNAAGGFMKAMQPPAPSQAEITEQRKTLGAQNALEVEENYHRIKETRGAKEAQLYLNREWRTRRSGMGATEMEAFQGHIRATIGGSLQETEYEWETEARKIEFEQRNAWVQTGRELAGPLSNQLSEDELMYRGWSYERMVAQRADEQAHLALLGARRSESHAQVADEVRVAMPEAMTRAEMDILNVAQAVRMAPQDQQESVRRDAIAQLERMRQNPSQVLRPYLPDGAQIPDQDRKEFEGLIDFQIELLTGKFDSDLNEQDITNVMNHYARQFALSDGSQGVMALAGIVAKTGVDFGGLPNPAMVQRGAVDNPYRMEYQVIPAAIASPSGMGRAAVQHGMAPSNPFTRGLFLSGAETVHAVNNNPDFPQADREKAAMIVSNTVMDVARGRNDERLVALGSGGFTAFLDRMRTPLTPEMKELVEQQFEAERTTALNEWRESFRVFTRDVLEPSLSKQDPKLVQALRYEVSGGRLRVRVDYNQWGSSQSGHQSPPSPRANPRQQERIGLVIRSTERELNKFVESYMNVTNGNRDEILEALLAVLQTRDEWLASGSL